MKNIKNRLTATAMLAATTTPALLTGFTTLSNSTVFAQTISVTETANLGHQPTTSVDGQIPADGTITIKGADNTTADGDPVQSLKNKKFMVYKIFDVENAAHEESVNYKFVDKYKLAVQTVVAKAINARDGLNKQPSDISEYAAIDYMYSLSDRLVEGAKTEQRVEGTYSAFRYFAEDLKNEIRKQGIVGDEISVAQPDAQNQVRLTGLSWGYYIVDEVTTGDDITNGQPGTTPDGQATDGKHFAASLLLLNTVNNEATITLKSDFPYITKKIQEDDARDVVGNDGWNDIGDFEIGQTVPYSNDVILPNMNGYHGYYFAIQDKMDQELTFHADKSKMKLTITKGGKKYVVQPNEYNLSTYGTNVTAQHAEVKGGIDGDSTFVVEFEDIKAIIDREFQQKNADGENDYSGLTLRFEYEATLNELAADKTGRPGFENDVRLIFSNDPDSTGRPNTDPNTPPGPGIPNIPPKDQPKGKTPWDTVVAFTYRLNGLKVNPHNFALQGAQFKIYSDKEMQNEVYVMRKDASQDKGGTNTNDPGIDTSERPGGKNTVDTVGTTNNLTGTDTSATRGTNQYVVINRDKVGGTDHTGGTVPENAVTIESDKDGNFSIVGLDSGTYYLKEVKPPVGYRLLEKPIELNITANMTKERNSYIKGEGATDKTLKSIDASGKIEEFYDQIIKKGASDLVTNAEEGSVDIKVTNEVLRKLPVTGQTAMFAAVVIGAGAVSVGLFGATRKKKSVEATE